MPFRKLPTCWTHTTEWGTARYSAINLIEDALNLRTPTVYDPHPDDRNKRMINPAATEDLGVRRNTRGDAFIIKIENRLYQNREEAGGALNRLAEKYHLSSKLVDVGELAGFKVQLWPERVKELVLRGKNAYVANISDIPLGTVSSLEHVVRSLDERLNEFCNDLAQTKHRVEELQPHAHKPFEHEDKLKCLIKRQQDIVQALDLTKNQASNSLAAESPPVVEESFQEGHSIAPAIKPKMKLAL